MQTHAQVVVIGGGVTGCSVLYHLAKMGWTDVVLLERMELASGSSWHAAGGLAALTSPNTACVLQKYTIDLYPELEKESEQPLGYHPVGGINLARSEDQMKFLRLALSRARRNDIDAGFLTFAEAREMSPILDTAPLAGVLFERSRGHIDPSSVTHGYAKAARKLGATVERDAPVIETNPLAGGGWQVVTPKGTIEAEYVVNAAGLWAREVAALAGITLPLMPVEHHYLVTEAVPELVEFGREVPSITDPEASFYGRQEGQGLLIGVYETPCRHWAAAGTPQDFGHELLPDDVGRMEENFAMATEAFPCLGRVGIKQVVNGPMIFSPDLGPLLGPYPGVKNYFCACGVMTGFNQSGGVGRVIAEWIIDGEPSLDVFCWDVTRFGPWASGAYTRARTKYFYEHRMTRTYPYQEYYVGRPLKTSPVYDRLKAAGAVFGFSYGLESPLWFARDGAEPRDELTFHRANWFAAVGDECHAVREGVGLFEISSFAKYEVRGPGAEAWLDRLLANRVPRTVGRTVLSPMLNDKGRLAGDLTVTRLGEARFLLLGSGAMQGYHMRHFGRFLPADGVALDNVSDRYAGLHVAGPKARELLAEVAEAEVANDAFPFLSARLVEVAGVPGVVAVRISFTGELGYELYCPAEYQRRLFEALAAAGEPHGLRLAGGRAMMSLRLEKGFGSWGLEYSPDYTPFDAGLDRFVKLDKDDFVGRAAALGHHQRGPRERLVIFDLDVDGTDAFGGEAVWRNGERVGYVTSGGYGHCVGKSLALGYLKPGHAESGAEYAVEILGDMRPAVMAAEPPFDPKGERMRG